MTVRFFGLLLLISSSVACYVIAARRLRKRGKKAIGVLNPLVFYCLSWSDYLLMFGIIVLDLVILVTLHLNGLLLPR